MLLLAVQLVPGKMFEHLRMDGFYHALAVGLFALLVLMGPIHPGPVLAREDSGSRLTKQLFFLRPVLPIDEDHERLVALGGAVLHFGVGGDDDDVARLDEVRPAPLTQIVPLPRGP